MNRRGSGSRLKAFSLVEVALALGVAAFALVAIFGLLPVGINTNYSSIQQTAATNIATAIIADLQNAPNAAAIAANPSLESKSQRYGIDVAASSATLYLGESGNIQPSAATSRYKVTVTLSQPAAGKKSATTGIVKIAWPPAATKPFGAVSVFVALERN